MHPLQIVRSIDKGELPSVPSTCGLDTYLFYSYLFYKVYKLILSILSIIKSKYISKYLAPTNCLLIFSSFLCFSFLFSLSFSLTEPHFAKLIQTCWSKEPSLFRFLFSPLLPFFSPFPSPSSLSLSGARLTFEAISKVLRHLIDSENGVATAE